MAQTKTSWSKLKTARFGGRQCRCWMVKFDSSWGSPTPNPLWVSCDSRGRSQWTTGRAWRKPPVTQTPASRIQTRASQVGATLPARYGLIIPARFLCRVWPFIQVLQCVIMKREVPPLRQVDVMPSESGILNLSRGKFPIHILLNCVNIVPVCDSERDHHCFGSPLCA